MSQSNIRCVLLADRHHDLTEGIRGLLETMFDAVVMVADEKSLHESALRLQPSVAVVDLSLVNGGGLGVTLWLRANNPGLKLVVLSMHDDPSVCRAVLDAGANAFVLKRTIGTDLLPAIEALLAGGQYVSPGVHQPPRL